MITIYFDGVLVDSDNYLEIKNDYKMFDNSFYLGATPSNSFDIKVPNTFTIPSVVTIYMDNVLYATLNVDSYSIDDNNILNLKLVDNMVKFDKEYDASGIVPCTTGDILSDICTTFGVTLGTNSFTNDDIPVDYYDNTYTAREYIGYIAELNGGYACIGANGNLYLKQFTGTPIELDIESCEDFKLGQKHKIERIVYDNGLVKYESSSDETKETLYLNTANVYINDETTFNKIVNIILDFEFYNFSTGNCIVNYNALCGDLIKFTDSNSNEYLSISQYSHEYNGGWLGGYDLNLESVFQAETQIKGDSEKIKAIKITQDRQANTLDITVSRVDDSERNISNLQITDNEIRASVDSLSGQVSTIMTDTYTKTQIDTKLEDGSVKKVVTMSGTFDADGMHYEKSGAETSTTINEVGVGVKPSEQSNYILFAGYVDDNNTQYADFKGQTIVAGENLRVNNYLIVGSNSRMEDYEDGTGMFYIGG